MRSYNISVNEGIKTSVTLFHEGVPFVATKEHPNFDAIVETLEQPGDDTVAVDAAVALFDLTKPIFDKFDHLSERVTVSSGSIFFDGDVIDDALSQIIVTNYQEGNEDYKRLVYFLEKLATNPNEHSRKNLYAWLSNNSFSIAPDGDFIAYKGLTQDRNSIHSGKATVNGVVIEGQIPNAEGDVIEMPRSDVQHDPYKGCHTGLHAGTWQYASGFGHGTTIKVKINPRDVVSVPVDCGAQKLRCCRYQALEITEAPETTIQYSYGDTDWDDDWADDFEANWDDDGIDEELPCLVDEDDSDDEPELQVIPVAGYAVSEEEAEAFATEIRNILSGLLNQEYFPQSDGASFADQREARRLELTNLGLLDVAFAGIQAGVDLAALAERFRENPDGMVAATIGAIVESEFPTA